MQNLNCVSLRMTMSMKMVADAFDEYLDSCEFDELIEPENE